MLDPANPARLATDIAFAVIGIALVVWLAPRQLRRVRQYGGRPLAQIVTVLAVIVLAVSLQADLIPMNTGLMLTIASVFIVFRPEAVVRLTGGPSIEWIALAEGTALQHIVAARADRRSAQHLPEVHERLARLAATETPTTARYVELVRTTLFADPDGPGMADRLAALAVEETALRRLIGPRPVFEGGLVEIEEEPVRPSLTDEDDDVAADADDVAEPPRP